MAIFYSPYSTTIGQMIDVKEQTKLINNALGMNYPWLKLDNDRNVITVYPNSIIGKFDHPIVIEHRNGVKLVAVDLSAFVREMPDGNMNVQNKALYSLQTMRAYLTADLIEYGSRNIKSLPGSVVKTYAELIATSLSMALNLHNDESLAIKAIAAWFYYCCLNADGAVGELEFQTIVARISRDTGIPATYITRYVENKQIENVEGLLEVIKSKIDNPNMYRLNIGVFYTVIAKNLNSAGWVGLEKQQMLAVAVEHIPTFVSLLVMCSTEQVFRNTGLTKMAQRNFGRDGKNFLLTVNAIINPN